MRISQKVEGIIMQNLRYTNFYMKTNLLQNFHVCIIVPLYDQLSGFPVLQRRHIYQRGFLTFFQFIFVPMITLDRTLSLYADNLIIRNSICKQINDSADDIYDDIYADDMMIHMLSSKWRQKILL